jgi:hypothetical protein
MSVFHWLLEFDDQARACGDEQRLQLLETSREAGSWLRSDPARALAIYEEGRRLALSLSEPWWVMYFTHWKLQVLLNYRPDFREAQRLGVEATLEARKPTYEGLPQRVCLHDDLVNSYVGSDPAGHAEAIREALGFMEAEVAPDLECRYCIQGEYADFGLGIGALEEAEKACSCILALAADEASPSTRAHHTMTAESRLCEIAYLRRDWQALKEHAECGEECHREVPRPQLLAEFLTWQALLERRRGEEIPAKRLLRRAEEAVNRSGAVPRSAYFAALCAYHLEGGDLERALQERCREQALIQGKGAIQREVHCWLERCRILARLGRLSAETLTEARTAISRLRKPEEMLAELDQLKGAP